MEKYPPSAVLRPFVKTFMIIESHDGMENRILPDTSIVMAFRFRGTVASTEEGNRHELPSSVITGIRKSTRLISYGRDAATLLVQFNEGGAAAFFEAPMRELFGISVPLECLMPRYQLAEVEERLCEATDNPQRVAIVEHFLLSGLKEDRPDLLVRSAVAQIMQHNGDVRIKDLARSLYISQDPFEKRFRRAIGASPKQFSNIVRLKHAINQHAETESLTDTAHRAGYFDQAHFIKDFRAFTGQTPQDFFRTAVYW